MTVLTEELFEAMMGGDPPPRTVWRDGPAVRWQWINACRNVHFSERQPCSR